AERRVAAARDEAAALESNADAAVREATGLERQARELATVLGARARLTEEAVAPPGSGLEAVEEWGTRARAALLVARSQLAAEKDGVVRQVLELGGLVLGEPLPPTSAAAVARRVERELNRRRG
ncbi:MAG: hypothetical protein ACRDNG_11730, partial [Gaiellaceae bacterium]